ncbi:MAG: peptidase domain-containing ABC transporter [Pseudomonadota bacterium]
MKPILQSEAAECGLACIAMVADAHGMHVGLPALRQRFPLSLKGAKLGQLIQIAQRLGFRTRALRLELDDLPMLGMPCILHWDLNHFVVLVAVDKGKVRIHDPAYGERVLPIEEVSKHFTGIALELSPGVEFKRCPPAPGVTLRELTGPVRGLWSAAGQVLGLSFALQILVVISPFFMQWVVDQVLVSADRSLLLLLAVGFGLSLLIQVGIGLLRGWSVVYISSQLGLQWSANVLAHVLRLPLDFFEKRHLGDIVSRMSSIQAIQRTLTTDFIEAVVDGAMAIVTLTMMLIYSWKLTLATLVAVAIYIAVRALGYGAMRDRMERQLMAAASQQSHLFETISGMQSIKTAGLESHRHAAYCTLLNNTVNQDIVLARMGLGFNAANQLVFGIERIVVIWIAATLAMSNVFSVGMLVAYLAYKDLFATRVAGLIDKLVGFRMLRVHSERLAELVLTPPEADDGLPEGSTLAHTGIEVENLAFRYADGEAWVFRDCGFRIAPGESVAIVGASGCGKTTLLKLMLGLLKPTAGTVRIGGIDVHRAGAREVRARIGVVMQDDQLFAGSVADNIALFDPDQEPARIERAARMAAVHDEILAMPMGYNSLIGDMGSVLSGGQKQRVILARALYREPALLFLDEATSHLDVDNERLVNEAIRSLALTKVIVAHRPETIASADRVLVLRNGEIREDAI